MNQYLQKIEDLKKLIDTLTESIADNVSKNLLTELDGLLSQRHNLIAELILLHSSDESRKDLINYLISIRKRDHGIMQVLVDERDQVKNTLLQMNKVKEYLGD